MTRPETSPGLDAHRGPDQVSKSPPASSHWALVISMKPLPLQLFIPLQLLVAVLHELWPLHELAPMHLPTLPALAVMGAVANRAAAVTASAAPVVFFCNTHNRFILFWFNSGLVAW